MRRYHFRGKGRHAFGTSESCRRHVPGHMAKTPMPAFGEPRKCLIAGEREMAWGVLVKGRQFDDSIQKTDH